MRVTTTDLTDASEIASVDVDVYGCGSMSSVTEVTRVEIA
jgi:hypothetical protein